MIGKSARHSVSMQAGSLLDTLRTLESELHHPGVACTRERLEALLHPDFHEVGRSGRIYTRETVVEHLATRYAPSAVVASDHRVAMLADGCALLTFRSEDRAPDGTPRLAALRASVWLHTPLGWRLRYHQGTPEAG